MPMAKLVEGPLLPPLPPVPMVWVAAGLSVPLAAMGVRVLTGAASFLTDGRPVPAVTGVRAFAVSRAG
jgi:hypothetical protein